MFEQWDSRFMEQYAVAAVADKVSGQRPGSASASLDGHAHHMIMSAYLVVNRRMRFRIFKRLLVSRGRVGLDTIVEVKAEWNVSYTGQVGAESVCRRSCRTGARRDGRRT
jgi:hypothetical protein